MESNTSIFRLALLLFLPIIALSIYWESRTYDPGLLDFQGEVRKADPMPSYFPEEFSAYSKSTRIRRYQKENLYEYINGHAEFFISSGFRDLAVAGYYLKDPDNQDINADIYDMGEGENAFGVLMEERAENARKIELGYAGYVTERTLSFIKGKFYIKLQSFKDNLPLQDLAGKIEKGMGNLEISLPLIDIFPQKGKIENSLKYFRENYRGTSFMSRVFEQEYERDGDQFQIFIRAGEGKEKKIIMGKYFTFFRNEKIPYEERSSGGKSYYMIPDPYEGKWYLIPREKILVGIYGIEDEEALSEIISEIE